MKVRVVRSSAAILDYASILERFISLDAIDAGARFAEAFDETLEFIERFPDLGELRPDIPSRAGIVRIVPVRRFPNYLIYFERGMSRVVVLRVLHGSRQIDPEIYPELPNAKGP